MAEKQSLKTCPRVLTHLGYSIRKDSLTDKEKEDLRKELTVAPKLQGSSNPFAKQPDSFAVYLESGNRYYCPRMWAIEKYGPPLENILVEGNSLREDLKFVGTPYDYQNEIINNFVEKGGNGLICVPCGRGKTFMAIACAVKLNKKFMVIVDKEFLLQQWAGELKSLLPGIRIGILQGDSKQITSDTVVVNQYTLADLKQKAKEAKLKVSGKKEDLIQRLKDAGIDVSPKLETIEYDCTIAMIQTLCSREFAETDFRSFGFSIFDECHHLGAAHFSRALLKIQTKWMLGLSATPTRDDGLTKVFEWFLGKPLYWEKVREADPDVVVKRVLFTTKDTSYTQVPTDYRGEIVLARLLTQVVENEERNKMIDQLLADLIKEPQRKILVLSERKAHLERIEKGLPPNTSYSYYIGGMKEEVREEGARTSQVLLGTYQMASEAMNIKTLNTMIMASPRKKIEQSTGRILRTRKDEREVDPVIVDIIDSHDVYQGQWMKKRAYYKKCAYKILSATYDPEDNPSLSEFIEETKAKKSKKEETPITQAAGCLIID